MSRTPIDPDEIAATVPRRRIERLRDDQDVMDLAAMLVTVFDVDQIAIADALRQRRLELKLKTWNPDGEEAYE
jgi:hypothetical protein